MPYLNMPYLNMPYLNMPYLDMSYLDMSYLNMPYLDMSYLNIAYLIRAALTPTPHFCPKTHEATDVHRLTTTRSWAPWLLNRFTTHLPDYIFQSQRPCFRSLGQLTRS